MNVKLTIIDRITILLLSYLQPESKIVRWWVDNNIDKINWNRVICRGGVIVSEQFILDYASKMKMDASMFTIEHQLSSKFLDIISIYIQNLDDILNWCVLDEWFIDKHIDKLCMMRLIKSKSMRENMVIKYQERFSSYDWMLISEHVKLSPDTLLEFKDELDWTLLIQSGNLTEYFIDTSIISRRENSLFGDISAFDDLNLIVKHNNVSENFLNKYIGSIDPKILSRHCQLSMDFIKQNTKYLDSFLISQHQKLDMDTIRELKNWLIMFIVFIAQDLSPEFIIEMQDDFNKEKEALQHRFKSNKSNLIDLYNEINWIRIEERGVK